MEFPGDDSRNGFRTQHSSVWQWTHFWRQPTVPFGRISLVFQRSACFNSGYKFMRQSTWLVFLVTTHLALFSFVVLRPLMLDIMAGMDQKDSFMRGFWWLCDVVWW